MWPLTPSLIADRDARRLAIVLREVGDRPHLDFEIKDHVALGEHLAGLDGATGAKITGARFTVLSGAVARLHRALITYMIDAHVDVGYTELNVPYIVNADSLYGTGQLPKFGDDLFRLTEPADYYLIPTAEVPVTNMVRDEIVAPERLPLRYVAHTPCFRAEAGAAGRDVRGMIRQHQFEKVELINIAHPDDSDACHQAMVERAEAVLASEAGVVHFQVIDAGQTLTVRLGQIGLGEGLLPGDRLDIQGPL